MILRGFGRVLVPLTASLLVATAHGAPAKTDTVATIKQKIESRFPGAHVLDVQPSVIPGVYELFMGDQIVYSDASGDYLIVGSIVETQTKHNLTEARLNELEHFRTDIDGQSIHFVHAPSSREDALPLLITHGWPGSIVEFLKVIGPLVEML